MILIELVPEHVVDKLECLLQHRLVHFQQREVVRPHDRNPVMADRHCRHLFEDADVVGGVELLMVPCRVAKFIGRIDVQHV